jgi:DNA replication protein DnaC
MKILKLETPKMGNVNMKCDSVIDPKLEKYDAVRCAFSQCNFTIIAGKTGQGKTSLLINLMRNPLHRCYHNIYVIIPEISLHSIAPKDNIFVNNIPEECMYHDYNEAVLEDIYEKLNEHANNDEFSLLVIDDMGSLFRKQKEAEVVLNRMITKNRHLKTTIMLLAQNIYQLPKKWREGAHNLITYNLGKSQMGKIFNEFYDYSDKQYQQIMKLYKNPHDWLILNLKHQRLFFKFDAEVIFEEPEEKPTPDTKPK